MKKYLKDILIVGFALFSMLFGAGNVIFPPYLGLGCGNQWILGFSYYYIADIGLALTCLFAIERSGGHREIIRHLGRIPGEMLIFVITLCIGPMLGIPRTAASTLEMSVEPLFPGVNPQIFSVLFFALAALLCMKETAVVDIIGRVLTPVLIAGLLILIGKGILSPIGPLDSPVRVENVPVTGINAGYQTMDVLAVVIFGLLISRSIREKGYARPRQQRTVIFGAGAVAGLSLLGVYLGLTYLGASASGKFDLTVDHTFLITAIVHLLLGQTGTVIFALVVAMACLTTAVALVSACSDYFSSLTRGKIPYIWVVLTICTCSAVISTFGLNQIIAVAGPVLDVVYPPTLLIIVLSFWDAWIPSDWVYRFGALGACAVSLLGVLEGWILPVGWLSAMPLYAYGFGWVLPALGCAALGLLVPAHSSDSRCSKAL